MVELFDKGDESYLSWLKEHPNGFVVNRFRSKFKYRMLHKATCRLISILQSRASEGGFTERQYVKECGSEEELVNKHQPERCSFCEP